MRVCFWIHSEGNALFYSGVVDFSLEDSNPHQRVLDGVLWKMHRTINHRESPTFDTEPVVRNHVGKMHGRHSHGASAGEQRGYSELGLHRHPPVGPHARYRVNIKSTLITPVLSAGLLKRPRWLCGRGRVLQCERATAESTSKTVKLLHAPSEGCVELMLDDLL